MANHLEAGSTAGHKRSLCSPPRNPPGPLCKTSQQTADALQLQRKREALQTILNAGLAGLGFGAAAKGFTGLRSMFSHRSPEVALTSSIPTQIPVMLPPREEEEQRPGVLPRRKLLKAGAADESPAAQLGVQQYLPVQPRRALSDQEQRDIARGKSQWLPQIFQHYGTPVPSMMASPLKQGLMAALAAGGVGALAGGTIGSNISGSTPMSAGIGAAAGGLGLGGIAGLVTGLERNSKNQGLVELMKRLPENAVKRDLLSDPAYQQDKNRETTGDATQALIQSLRPGSMMGQFPTISKYSSDGGIIGRLLGPKAAPAAPGIDLPRRVHMRADADAAQSGQPFYRTPEGNMWPTYYPGGVHHPAARRVINQASDPNGIDLGPGPGADRINELTRLDRQAYPRSQPPQPPGALGPQPNFNTEAPGLMPGALKPPALKKTAADGSLQDAVASQLPDTGTTTNPAATWWGIPATVGAGGAGIAGGWSLVDWLLNKRRKSQQQGDLDTAQQEYEKSIADQYRQALSTKHASGPYAALDELYDRFCEASTAAPGEKQADWDLTNKAVGGYLTAAGLLATGAGYGTYNWAKNRSKQKLLEKAIALRARQRQAPQPVYAVPQEMRDINL